MEGIFAIVFLFGGASLIGFSFTKKECETVVLAQNFAAIGMTDTACDVLLTTAAAKRAFKGRDMPKCNPQAAAPQGAAGSPTAVADATSSKYATKEELDRAVKAALSK